MSLPSPGSQTNVSLPLPNSPTSLPPFPSIESLPLPPSSVSAPEPPARMSFPLPPSSVTAPAPPTRLSSPFPPSIVVGMVSVKRPLLSSMRTTSSPFPPLTEIFRDLRTRESEVGRAVVPDVDLQNRRVAALQPKCEPVARVGSLDRQLAMRELRIIERRLLPQLRRLVGMVGGRGAVSGRGPCRAADGGDRSHCRDRQQCRPHYTRVVESNEVPHGFLSGVE